MKTFFPASFNWPLYLLAIIILRLLFVDISWFSFIAIAISIYQFILLFDSIGFIIPVRHLLGAFMCIQFFIGPTFAYNGLDAYQYQAYLMKIPETEYFSYVIPAVALFIVGLHINAGKYRGEIVDKERVALFVLKNPLLPYIFLVGGFFISILSGFFGSGLSFVFYLLGSFKFIGLFLLVLGTKQIKLGIMTLVIASIISSSLGSGMFHDLITWVIFTAAVFGIKYRFSVNIKLIGLTSFVLIAITIQILKGDYRKAIATGVEGGNAETFSNIYEQENEGAGVFSFKNLAQSNVRINQGFIITNIMQTVPAKVPYARGDEMYQILEAAILPRFLAPNKLRAGDRSIFMKYSYIPIQAGTSMGLSSVGDAYVNWGVMGGIVFMFFLGVLYSEVLNSFQKYSARYPVLILFTALVFYYPIRPDCELQTILGHLVKSCFLIYAMIYLNKGLFTVARRQRQPVASLAPEIYQSS